MSVAPTLANSACVDFEMRDICSRMTSLLSPEYLSDERAHRDA